MAHLKATLIVLAFFIVVIGIGWGFGWGKCSWYGYQTERVVKFSGSIGCMVQSSSGWTPRSEIRTTLD